MLSQKVTILNKLGLHARASALLSDTAIKFQSSIIMQFKGRDVDAKSILDVMTMGGVQGNDVDLIISGPDEERALHTIAELFNNKFNEAE